MKRLLPTGAPRGLLSRRLSAALLLVLVPGLAWAEDPPAGRQKPAPSPAPKAPFTPPVPDPEPWFSVQGASLVSVSRDGSKAFVRMLRDGATHLFRIDRDGGWPHRLTFGREGLDFAAVSPDGRWAVLAYDTSGDENYGLFLMGTRDEDAGKTAPLDTTPGVQRGDVTWAEEGDRIFFRSNADTKEDFHLVEMTLADRKTRTILSKPGSWGIEDVAPGGKRLLVRLDRGGRDSSLYVLDLPEDGSEGEPREIDPLPAGKRASLGGAQFLGGGGATVVFASDRGGEWERLWTADLATGRVEALLASDAEGPIEPMDVEDFEVTADGEFVWYTVNHDGAGELRHVYVPIGIEYPAPRTRRPIAGGLRVDGKGSVYVVVSDASMPSRIVRFDPGSDEPALLTWPEFGGLPESAMPARPRAVHYPSFDGTKIPAWLYLPAGKDPKNLPFVLSIHGGPEGQERPYFSGERAYLLSLGYGILAPNVRGSTGYGRAWANADDYKGRSVSVKDAKAGADWLAAEGLADPKKIAAFGGSYGGFMVLALLTEYPDAFAAGIDMVGIANFETFLERTAPYRRALREAEYGPLSDREFLRSISPIHKVDCIKAPLFLVHGEQDPRVPVGEAKQIEKELKALSRPCETLYFRNEGHGISHRANRLAFARRAAAFLSKTIGR